MKSLLHLLAKSAPLALAVLVGMVIGHLQTPRSIVRAQDKVFGSSTCTAMVPSSLGEFKGGSSYGLAFQDSQGVIRFILNPPCGGAIVNGYQQPANAYVALEIQRH